MKYKGGKGQPGVYQRIISLMPPHDLYVEAFAGGAAILQRKKPAEKSFAFDLDVAQCERIRALGLPGLTVAPVDAIAWLNQRIISLGKRNALVYADPPYVRSTRKYQGRVYTHEFSDDDHRSLVLVLNALRCSVIVSGYAHPIYDDVLVAPKWRREAFRVRTRKGWATEVLWYNFPPPTTPHDTRYVGGNYRERERIKKRQARWVRMVRAMSPHERAAMLDTLQRLQ